MAIHVISKNTLSELKVTSGTSENIIITLGQNTKGDGKGALYYWDSLSTEVEDTIYYNIVKVNNVTTGRWKKVFTRMLTLPHGTLVMNSGKKEFFATKTVSATSDATIYLTMEGTQNGTPIFTEIWFDDSKSVVNTSNVNDAVSSYRISLSTNLKELKHGFFRGNSSLLNLSIVTTGLTVGGFRGALAGTTVNFKVEGI